MVCPPARSLSEQRRGSLRKYVSRCGRVVSVVAGFSPRLSPLDGTRAEARDYSSFRILQLAGGAPAFGVGFADDFGVGHGADYGTNLGLAVAFNRCLLRSAVLFTPDERDLRTDLDVGIDHTERQHRPFVV